jgi:hypothetical protein
MKYKLMMSFIVFAILMVEMVNISFNIAWSDSDRDKDYCYDQVGDGHFCFDSKQKCRHEQRHDEIAESLCYNKDRMY